MKRFSHSGSYSSHMSSKKCTTKAYLFQQKNNNSASPSTLNSSPSPCEDFQSNLSSPINPLNNFMEQLAMYRAMQNNYCLYMNSTNNTNSYASLLQMAALASAINKRITADKTEEFCLKDEEKIQEENMDITTKEENIKNENFVNNNFLPNIITPLSSSSDKNNCENNEHNEIIQVL